MMTTTASGKITTKMTIKLEVTGECLGTRMSVRQREKNMVTERRATLRSTTWMPLAFLAGVMLMAGCGADSGTGSGGNDPLGLSSITAGATDATVSAQGQPDADSDPEDGDTQTGEFEGEHQFGANDEDADDADDDFEDGPNDQVEDGQDDVAEGTELTTVISEGAFRAVVEYEEETERTSFEVEVTGGQPDATLDVAVNGVVVLSITLDSTGGGEFEFSSAPEDPEEQQLPTDFPVLGAGDIVAVGDLTGVLEVEEDD